MGEVTIPSWRKDEFASELSKSTRISQGKSEQSVLPYSRDLSDQVSIKSEKEEEATHDESRSQLLRDISSAMILCPTVEKWSEIVGHFGHPPGQLYFHTADLP